MIQSFNSEDSYADSQTFALAKRRVRRKRRSATIATPVPPPINTIASVTVQEDLRTIDIFFTPGTHVTAVNEPDDNFFVNYSGEQTSGSTVTIVNPAQVRIMLSDAIDSPATWEVDSEELFTFASGTFGGPNDGDVVFV